MSCEQREYEAFAPQLPDRLGVGLKDFKTEALGIFKAPPNCLQKVPSNFDGRGQRATTRLGFECADVKINKIDLCLVARPFDLTDATRIMPAECFAQMCTHIIWHFLSGISFLHTETPDVIIWLTTFFKSSQVQSRPF